MEARVLFYISGHGFGHASREVEVINALTAAAPSAGRAVSIAIRSAVSPALLQRTIRGPFDLRPGACDTGIVQRNSITHDDAATIGAARAFYADFDGRADAEARALASDPPALIVTDIAPLGAAVAARLRVPCLMVANFTWDWIYEGIAGFADGAPGVIDTIRRAHASVTRAVRLPFSPEFSGTGIPAVTDAPMIARRPAQSRAATRAHFGLAADRKIALLSFGGYGLDGLDLTSADCFAEWDVIGTDRSIAAQAASHPHILRLDEADLASARFRYEDLVAAADAVLTKPGFGIIGECLSGSTPMVYTSRGAFREYDILVHEMPRFLRCAFLPQADLFEGRWRAALDAAAAAAPPPQLMRLDGAEVVARQCLALISSSSS